MVLSENNEPFIENKPSESVPDPVNEEISDSTVPESNPGERLRSIEMASSQKKGYKSKIRFIQSLSNIKNQKDKLAPFFNKYRGAFPIIFNIFLLIVILLLSRQVFSLKKMIVGDVLGGLYMNIEEMDKANISTDLSILDNIQLDFPVPINQETDLVLVADTVINGARISISTGALNIIGAPATIVLPAGTRLPVQLSMEIPINTSVPVNLNAPIDIPLAETDLHRPLANMQNIIEPQIISFMDGNSNWQEMPACKVFGFICKWWFK